MTGFTVWLSAPGFRTAHLARSPGAHPGPHPLTVCGRVMRAATPAPVGVPHCRHCKYSSPAPVGAAHPPGVSEPTVEPPEPATGASQPHLGPFWTDLGDLRAEAAEVARLTAALHTHCAHPDWIYLYTVGGASIPPSTVHGTGWVENPDDPRHGAGIEPTITWSWRRPKTAEETA